MEEKHEEIVNKKGTSTPILAVLLFIILVIIIVLFIYFGYNVMKDLFEKGFRGGLS